MSRIYTSILILLVSCLGPRLWAQNNTHNFVFWVNGDSFHQQHLSADSEAGEFEDVVADDVREILQRAKECACNVYIKYDTRRKFISSSSESSSRRGRNYRQSRKSKKLSSITYVVRNGVLESAKWGPEINMSRTRTLRKTLAEAHKLFPSGPMHLVYRGHSLFDGNSKDGRAQFRGFDLSHPRSKYSYKTFLKSIAKFYQKTHRRLSGVYFAACNMSYIELATGLSPYADFMVATQMNILDQLDVGFSFSYLNEVTGRTNSDEVAQLVARRSLEKFEFPDLKLTSRLRETPITLIDLSKFQDTHNKITQDIYEKLTLLSADERQEIIDLFRIKIGPSEAAISYLGSNVFSPLPQPGSGLDYVSLAKYLELEASLPQIDGLLVFNRPPLSTATGISMINPF